MKGNSLSIGIDNLAVSVLKFKHMIKYIRSEVAKNPSSAKRISILCSSNSLNRQLLRVTSECSRLIELIVDTHKEETKAF